MNDELFTELLESVRESGWSRMSSVLVNNTSSRKANLKPEMNWSVKVTFPTGC